MFRNVTPARSLTFGAALLVVASHSSEAGARGISFAEARRAAERQAPDVHLSALRSQVSRAEVGVAGGLPNPTIGVATATQTARLSTSLSVPIPLFGQFATAADAARADVQTAKLDVAVAVRDARWSATLSWVDLWEADRRAELFAERARDAQRLLGIATEKFNAGTGSRVDIVRATADRATAAAEAESARRDVAAAAARLSTWIGADPREALEPAGEPGYPANAIALDSLSPSRAHPVLRRDEAAIAAASSHVTSERRQRWPLVVPQVTLNQFDPTLPGPDLIVGVSFDLPLFNMRGGEVARAQAEEQVARAQASWDSRRLTAETFDAYRRLQAADAKLRALKDQVLPAMREAETMTEEAYADGRMELTRVLEAQRALLDTRMNEAETIALRARSLADLEHSLGTDLTEARRAR
jgi:outer membrane protein TolC